MDIVVLIVTVLASISVGLLVLRKSARSHAWLDRIEAKRVIDSRSLKERRD